MTSTALAPSAIEAVAQSNLPSDTKKTLIRRMYEGLTGGVTSAATQHVTGYVRETGNAIRQGGEALLTGGVLGLIDAEHGLDNGLGIGPKFPIDGALAAAGLLGRIFLAHESYGVSQDLGNIGSDALSIYTFRKAKEWRENKHGGKTTTHGESDTDDDLVAIANSLQNEE